MVGMGQSPGVVGIAAWNLTSPDVKVVSFAKKEFCKLLFPIMDWERIEYGLNTMYFDLVHWIWARPYRNTLVGLMLILLFSQTIGLIVSEFFEIMSTLSSSE